MAKSRGKSRAKSRAQPEIKYKHLNCENLWNNIYEVQYLEAGNLLPSRQNLKSERKAERILRTLNRNAGNAEKLLKYNKALGLAETNTTKQNIYRSLVPIFMRMEETDIAFEALRLYHENAHDNHNRTVQMNDNQPVDELPLFSRFGTNERYPCFVPSVQPARLPGALVPEIRTSHTLQANEKIMVAKPFAWSFRNDNGKIPPHCATCGKLKAAFIPCDRCATTFYCSWKCRLTNKTHRFLCGTNFSTADIQNQVKLTVYMFLECLARLPRGSVEERNRRLRQIVFGQEEPTDTNPNILSFMLRLPLPDEVGEGICRDALEHACEISATNPQEGMLMHEKDNLTRNLLIYCAATVMKYGRKLEVKPNRTDKIAVFVIYDAPSYFGVSKDPPNVRIEYVDVNMVGTTTKAVASGSTLHFEQVVPPKPANEEAPRK